MPDSKKHDPFIFLSTRVVLSATSMIEQMGRLTGIRSCNVFNDHEPYQMADLRSAIARASRALENYDAAVASGLDEMTSAEFEAANRSSKAA